jgi:hypothetical protein
MIQITHRHRRLWNLTPYGKLLRTFPQGLENGAPAPFPTATTATTTTTPVYDVLALKRLTMCWHL